MSFLLDTNVVSEVRKPAGDPHVKAWLAAAPSWTCYVSVLVLGELRRGVELLRHRRDDAQVAALEAWLATITSAYAGRVIPVSSEIADTWGRLNVPDPLPAVDGLLAATALVHDWTLVTRNTAQVARTGVRLLDPFEPPAR
jgi:predicted nucleic acid-binding protein